MTLKSLRIAGHRSAAAACAAIPLPPGKAVGKLLLSAALALGCVLPGSGSAGEAGSKLGETLLPTGVRIDLSSLPGVRVDPLAVATSAGSLPVSGSFAMAVSPGGDALLVLSSGYNKRFGPDGKPVPDLSTEHVFVFDISRGSPERRAAIPLPNTFCGIDWNPNGKEFYVSGGKDDQVHLFRRSDKGWTSPRPPLSLDHRQGNGIDTRPMVSGLRVDPEGRFLLAADYANDSVSLIQLAEWKKIAELDLRPGKIDPRDRGVPGGEYPMDVAWAGEQKAYVASLRDRQIVVVGVENGLLRCLGRIPLQGEPNHILVNRARNRAYVTEDNADRVSVIDTRLDRVIEAIPTVAPLLPVPAGGLRKGASPNNLCLDSTEKLLYVTNGGMNCLSVIELGAPARGSALRGASGRAGSKSRVVALIPTGWYPTAVAEQRGRIYVATGKSVAGPNDRDYPPPPPAPASQESWEAFYKAWRGTNEYILQKSQGALESFSAPAPRLYPRLTKAVGESDRLIGIEQTNGEVMQELRRRIHHVLYVVKENRGYDQLFGTLKRGNGDPRLAILAPYCPNHRRLAEQFVLLDNFLDSGEVSGSGWSWSTEARALDITEKTVPLYYAGRGPTYDCEGENRNIAVGRATYAERKTADPSLPDDADLLPGTGNASAPDGPEGEIGLGYLWDAALRKGISIRNYGFFGDLTRYHLPPQDPVFIPLSRHPFAEKILQFLPTNPSLAKVSDPYYRGFDMKYADYWRFKEWEREFDEYVKNGNLPALELVRLPHDHFGAFRQAADRVDTVETQMADNDYAVGLLVEKIAHSPYKGDTLLFIIEDDAQNAADHVDAHRSIALVAGPFVKQETTVRKRFTTVNVLKTIEEILDFGPLSFYDQGAEAMAALFDPAQREWSYRAVVPEVLLATDLPVGGAKPTGSSLRHDALFWEGLMAGQDFSKEDRLDTERFNRALWIGLKGEDAPSSTRAPSGPRSGHLSPTKEP